jgi:hypothetical protein
MHSSCNLQSRERTIAVLVIGLDELLGNPTTLPSSSTTKAGRHDITEILMKVALSTINQIKSIAYKCRNMVLAIQSKTLSGSFRIHDLSVSL